MDRPAESDVIDNPFLCNAGVQQGGPADRAGLAEGDVVIAINGTEVRSSDVLRNTIAMLRPGTTVDLEVMKRTSGKTVIKAKLGELPGDTTAPTMNHRRIR